MLPTKGPDAYGYSRYQYGRYSGYHSGERLSAAWTSEPEGTKVRTR
jgi:hypothetical protein